MSNIDKNTRDEAMTFFVAECMEFHQAGVVHENIPTIEEAIEIYKKLPANKKHLGNGIGAMVDDWEYSLFEGGMVDTLEYYEDTIKTNPEIMSAVQTLTNYVAEKEQAKVIGDDKERKIAIFQKERTRYTFIYEEARNQYSVKWEHLLSTGAEASFENMSVEKAMQRLTELKSKDFFEFRNAREVSWYATANNNTPYEEKWEVQDGILVPIESHSVGITTFNGRFYSTVDEWANGTGNYELGQDNEDNTFFYARVTDSHEQLKGVYTYEYDNKPTRSDVEQTHLDRISEIDIDKHEAEFGADGRRAFPHLNDSEEITLHLKYQEPYVINGYVVGTDTIVFSDIESMNAFIKGEVSYDFLDNTVKKRENEILLYAENTSGKVIWDNREVERVDLPRQIEYRNKEHHVVLRQQYKQGNNHLFSDDNDYLYEIFQGTVNGGELHLFLRTDEEKILFSGKLDKDYEEFKVSLATVRLSDYSFATLAQRNDLVLPSGITYEALLHREETESFVYGEWAKENTAPVSGHTQGIVHDLVMDKDIKDTWLEEMIWDVLETHEKSQKQGINVKEKPKKIKNAR